MIVSVEMWMTKNRKSPNFQENWKMGVGDSSIFTSGGCGSTEGLKKYLDKCVLILTLFCVGFDRMLVYLNGYLLHVYNLIKVFNSFNGTNLGH